MNMVKSSSCEVILVRHAHSSANLKGVLAGRDNRVSLSDRGKQEAQDLARFLETFTFDEVYASPLRRCNETIAPYLASTGHKMKPLEGVIEMDYGSWSGKTLATLSKTELWKSIQGRPSTVRFPGGESFSEMSLRANQAVLEKSVGKKRILIVSHGDVIKSIVAFQLGLALDLFQRISIDPASVTMLKMPNSQVIQVNSTSHLSRPSKSATKGKGARDKFSLGGGQGAL
jgi:probable phosphomutase (TIGR03848 family)